MAELAFPAIMGLWAVLLFALAWILLIKPTTRPTSLGSAMLTLGLITGPGTFASTKSVEMTLAVVAMPIIGWLIGEIAIARWNKTHSNA